MRSVPTGRITERLSDAVHRLEGVPSDYDPLLDLVGDARVVLLGEASHGTQEFYRERAQITKRLIREKGFTAVAVEADWPDAYRVNRSLMRSCTSTRRRRWSRWIGAGAGRQAMRRTRTRVGYDREITKSPDHPITTSSDSCPYRIRDLCTQALVTRGLHAMAFRNAVSRSC